MQIGTCVCPAGAVSLKKDNETGKTGGRKFFMRNCSLCARPLMSEARADVIVKATGKDRSFFDKCAAYR